MKENSYFDWLLGVVEHEKCEKSYFLMLKELSKTVFWIKKGISRDANRAVDGIKLRDEYFIELREAGYSDYCDPNLASCGCSILEMIIGISKRMNDQLMTEEGEDKTAQYFWEIIENLGLDEFDDEEFAESSTGSTMKIRKICENLCERRYKSDGTCGGMFPMPGNTKGNQKKMEIWFQMQEYINWKYAIEG